MKQIIQDLRDFHNALDIPIGNLPQIPSTERVALRINLIEEEVNEELLRAMRDGDLVEMADAMVDSIYVIVGAALEYGIDLSPVWDEIQRTNMAKKDGPIREDGKRLKPAGWKPPQIREILIQQGAKLLGVE